MMMTMVRLSEHILDSYNIRLVCFLNFELSMYSLTLVWSRRVKLATTNKRLNGHNDQFENFHIGRVRGRRIVKK